MADQLDNPVWHALTGHQAHLASGTAAALRFDPTVALFAGFPDPAGIGVAAITDMLAPGEMALLFNAAPVDIPADCSVLYTGEAAQMVCNRLAPLDNTTTAAYDIITLGDNDVADMLALVKLTEPGPFFERTHVLGDYIGIRHGDQLVAMAGHRMRVGDATEISAVCTHPDTRGRGYAAALVHHLASRLIANGQRPFLHVVVDNTAAIRVYERLGFSHRITITAQVLRVGKPS